MSAGGAETAASVGADPVAAVALAAAMDERDRDLEPRTPMKRGGSTRKLAAFNNIRLQLAEQTRVLEARAEATAGVAGELHDYCRRRADLEHEYARALDKLTRAAHQRHKEQRHKRDQWPLTGAFACWQAALEATRTLSRDHAALADLYGGPLAARLQRAADDALRLHRKCRDIVAERHEEVGAALSACAAAGKAHAAAHADWRAAALKLRHTREQRRDPAKHKKIKALDKELEKRRARHGGARARALRARVEYVLSLEAANATLQRYYLDDIADIILCMEVGFEAVVGRVVRAASAAESARGAAADGAAAALRLAADALDALADRQRLLEAHAPAFALPRTLPAPPPAALPDEERAHAEDEEATPLDEERTVLADLEARRLQLEAGARLLRAECRENAKTLDAAELELVKQMEGSDSSWDVSVLFGAGALGGAGVSAALAAAPPPLDDQEDYYLQKFRAYVSCAARLARVESKAAALGSGRGAAGVASPPRRAARAPRAARSAFAAPLTLVLPRVLVSCVRIIGTYGLRQQGVFRVSGSQVEMQALRAAFERGEDPLERVRDASDMNTVCGLLKLWLRELRPPLLAPQLQERLVRIASLPDDGAFCSRLRDTLAALPLPAVLVLRYLFAFLAHLAEHAAHNMMDAWNLAVCVGPTLLAAWGDGAHQLAAQHDLNELVKRAILHHARVFPQDVAPHTLYQRPMSEADSNFEGGAAEERALSDADADADADEPDADADADERSIPHADTDEESSEELDSGEWAEGAAPSRSSSAERRAAQVRAPSPPTAPTPTPTPPAATDDAATPSAADPLPSPHCRRLAESTPDLVLDLPLRPCPVPSPAPPPTPPPADDPADTFAHNRDTLKKRPHKQPEEASADADGAGEVEVEVGQGSPVPARNTARVAAKFAELTLTGGSLKPALAAKPALLRRPTPHPRPPPQHPQHPQHPPAP